MLIIDDSLPIRLEVKKVLADAGVEVECSDAENGIEALKLLSARPIDLVLCDVEMPIMDGFQFLRMFRARNQHETTPVIMLTGRDNAAEKIFGLEAGATDYVTKPFIPGELVARVRVQLKVKALQDELRRANERFRELSITDFLTSLNNRRHFNDMLMVEINRAERYKNLLSLILFDIDHFKNINDSHGHATGDLVLAAVGQLMRTAFRGSDVVARFGGEEFATLLPQTDVKDAKKAAEKILVQANALAVGGLPQGSISFSAGIATFPSTHVTDGSTLIARADQALYRAKENGRHQVVIDQD